MRWGCSKSDLKSTLIYMPTPTRHPQTQGHYTPCLCTAPVHRHTHTHPHTLLDTDPHACFLLLPQPLSEIKVLPARGGGWFAHRRRPPSLSQPQRRTARNVSALPSPGLKASSHTLTFPAPLPKPLGSGAVDLLLAPFFFLSPVDLRRDSAGCGTGRREEGGGPGKGGIIILRSGPGEGPGPPRTCMYTLPPPHPPPGMKEGSGRGMGAVRGARCLGGRELAP